MTRPTDVEADFELWQDNMHVASAGGPREGALAEILHYAMVYGQDGPVTIYEVTRTEIDMDDAAIEAAQGRSHG